MIKKIFLVFLMLSCLFPVNFASASIFSDKIEISLIPNTLKINSSTKKLYSIGSEGFEVIDISTNKNLYKLNTQGIANAELDETLNRIYFLIDGYYSKSGIGELLIIDGNSNNEINRIEIGNDITNLIVKPGSNKVWLINSQGYIYVIDDVTANVSDDIVQVYKIKELISSSFYNSSTNEVYLSTYTNSFETSNNRFLVLDFDTVTISNELSISGFGPILGISKDNKKLYLASYDNVNYNQYNVYVINLESNSIEDSFNLPFFSSYAYDSNTNKLYAVFGNYYYYRKAKKDIAPFYPSTKLLNAIDLSDGSIIDSIAINSASSIAFDKTSKKLFIPEFSYDTYTYTPTNFFINVLDTSTIGQGGLTLKTQLPEGLQDLSLTVENLAKEKKLNSTLRSIITKFRFANETLSKTLSSSSPEECNDLVSQGYSVLYESIYKFTYTPTCEGYYYPPEPIYDESERGSNNPKKLSIQKPRKVKNKKCIPYDIQIKYITDLNNSYELISSCLSTLNSSTPLICE